MFKRVKNVKKYKNYIKKHIIIKNKLKKSVKFRSKILTDKKKKKIQ